MWERKKRDGQRRVDLPLHEEMEEISHGLVSATRSLELALFGARVFAMSGVQGLAPNARRDKTTGSWSWCRHTSSGYASVVTPG